MVIYDCFFVNKQNKFNYCKIYSHNKNDVVCLFVNMGFRLIDVKRDFISKYIYIFRNYKHIYEWFDLLYKLLNDGIRLDESLLIVSKMKLYRFSGFMCEMINSGYSFSQIIEKNIFFFGEQCFFMVNNLSGFLSITKTCLFMSVYYKKLYENQYGFFVKLLPVLCNVVISFFIIFLLLFFIKDEILDICMSFSITPPTPIQITFIIQKHFFIFIFLCCVALFCLYQLFLKINVFIHRDLYFFFSYLSDSIDNGIHILSAIDIFIQNTRVFEVKSVLLKVKNHMLSGKSFSKSIADVDFLLNYSQIVDVGEKTSSLSKICKSISEKEYQKYNDLLDFLKTHIPIVLYVLNIVVVFWVFGSILISLYISISFDFI